jgi:hypothetical protein
MASPSTIRIFPPFLDLEKFSRAIPAALGSLSRLRTSQTLPRRRKRERGFL